MLEEVYLYSVRPSRPIALSDGTVIRSAKSVYLSKEDLKTILPNSIIYRRFASGNVKVTTQNIDEVHVADPSKANSASTREAKVEEMSKHVGTVTVADPEPAKVVEPTPVVEEVKKEEPVVEAPTVEEKVEEPVVEAAPVEEAKVEEVVNDNAVDNNNETVVTEDEAATEEATATENVVIEADNEVEDHSNSDDHNYQHKNNNKKKNR